MFTSLKLLLSTGTGDQGGGGGGGGGQGGGGGGGGGSATSAEGTIALFAGGFVQGQGAVSQIDQISMVSYSDATDFGDLVTGGQTRDGSGAESGSTDTAFFTPRTGNIEKVTPSTPGNATDWGDFSTNSTTENGSTDNNTNGRAVTAMMLYNNNSIEYFSMTSSGNSTDFGDLTVAGMGGAALSNDRNERGVFMGRLLYNFQDSNVIDYITISTPGNATDFGDMTGTASQGPGASNGVFDTGISFIGGGNSPLNDYSIESLTISTLGNSTTWGERHEDNEKAASADRATADVALYAGGDYYLDHVGIIRISTPGSAVSFAQLSHGVERGMGASNSGLTATEQAASFAGVGPIPFGGDVGVIVGGTNAGTTVPTQGFMGTSTDIIQRITITSNADATDHGDLLAANREFSVGSNSGLGRCDVAGGTEGAGLPTNKIQHFTINTPGNSIDAGDLLETNGRYGSVGATNGSNDKMLAMGGITNMPDNVMQSWTMSSGANAADHGDLSSEFFYGTALDNAENDRGVAVFGQNFMTYQNTIEYVSISSAGNTTDFGDQTDANSGFPAGLSNGSLERGIMAGGVNSNVIDYITISTPGNATDFGDLTQSKYDVCGLSNGLGDIGLLAGGRRNSDNIEVNEIDRINISSTGNAIDHGGDLSFYGTFTGGQGASNAATKAHSNRLTLYGPRSTGTMNGSRGFATGGWYNSWKNSIEYVTIASAGNASSFGSLSTATADYCAGSSAGLDRNVVAGGSQGSTVVYTNTMEYWTGGTLGNATDFGDLKRPRKYTSEANSGSDDRMLIAGGNGGFNAVAAMSYNYALIEKITMSTTGNAEYYGDLIDGAVLYGYGDVSNGDRGLFAGGQRKKGSVQTNYVGTIEFCTISTDGAAVDFGSLAHVARDGGALNSGPNDRGVYCLGFAGALGTTSGSSSNIMEYVTISTRGNATDFGDIDGNTYQMTGNISDNSRGIFYGFANHDVNGMDYITIGTPGNAVHFGNLASFGKQRSAGSASGT